MTSHKASTRFVGHFIRQLSKFETKLGQLTTNSAYLASYKFSYPIIDPDANNEIFAHLWSMLFKRCFCEPHKCSTPSITVYPLDDYEKDRLYSMIQAWVKTLIKANCGDSVEPHCIIEIDMQSCEVAKALFLSYGFDVEYEDEGLLLTWVY